MYCGIGSRLVDRGWIRGDEGLCVASELCPVTALDNLHGLLNWSSSTSLVTCHRQWGEEYRSGVQVQSEIKPDMLFDEFKYAEGKAPALSHMIHRVHVATSLVQEACYSYPHHSSMMLVNPLHMYPPSKKIRSRIKPSDIGTPSTELNRVCVPRPPWYSCR